MYYLTSINKMKHPCKKLIPYCVILLATALFNGHALGQSCVWMNNSLSVGERAQLLLNASSLHQKYRWLTEAAANNPSQTNFATFDLSTFSMVFSNFPAQVSCTPTISYTDGPQGIRGPENGVTVFPAPIAMASTWDIVLSEEKGAAMAKEALGKKRNVILGPGLASGRTPFSGRNSEYFGEDPILSGTLAGYEIRGMQYGNSQHNVVSVLKHFVGNEQETDRSNSSSNIDERTLQQVYNLPFFIADDIGRPHSIMCAYNGVNGTPSCQNDKLLNGYLKTDMNFDGFVLSDFQAVKATGASIAAGLDQELGADGPIHFTAEKLDAAIATGEITVADIDAAAFRVVKNLIKAGLFDNPLPATAAANVSTVSHKATARKIAEQGSVLLKNASSLLPITGNQLTIAVIGATASATPTNGVSVITTCSATFNIPGFPPGPSVNCPSPIAPLDAISARAAQDGHVVIYDDGSNMVSAANAANQADIAIVFAYYEMGEFNDLSDLSLDNNGNALISAVASANNNTVVVLSTGSAVLMPWLDSVKSVLETWYPGSEQGTAIANLLWGDVNPSGKLPMTFPASENDIPTASPYRFPGLLDEDNVRQVEYSENLLVGYRWYDQHGIEPLFPFGHGLSYTSFKYSNAVVVPTMARANSTISVKFLVQNTGTRLGTEISQVYLTLPSSTGEPPKRLVGWLKVKLKPGETRYVNLDLDQQSSAKPTSYWDTAANKWKVASGSYSIQIGASSSDLRLSSTFNIF